MSHRPARTGVLGSFRPKLLPIISPHRDYIAPSRLYRPIAIISPHRDYIAPSLEEEKVVWTIEHFILGQT
jgi:hypothetical protein